MPAPGRKRTRSPGVEALPKISKKLEITEIRQPEPPVPARNFFVSITSKNTFSEDHPERVKNTNPAAHPNQPERI
jgi:hypothetical protein